MNKKTYLSLYSPGQFVTVAQYIAEIMCEKRAASLQRNLPTNFCKFDEWKGYYFYQLKLARKLLEEYDIKIILDVIRDSKIFSLRNSGLIKRLKYLQQKQPKQPPQAIPSHKPTPIDNTIATTRPVFKTSTLIDTLDSIDGN